MPAKQITIRNPDPELTERLKAVAVERGESLNATILRLLNEAVGVDAKRRRLDAYATWTQADADEFDAAVQSQRKIDEAMWE